MTTEKPLLIIVTGPTASGKTLTAIQIAQALETEIISCDSRQFYREMKIGTAAPTEQEQALVKHHFIGHLSVEDHYNVSKFESDALTLVGSLFLKYKVVVMAGGSGLYIDAVVRGIDELPDPDAGIRNRLKQQLKEEGLESLRFELQRVDPVTYRRVDLANPARLIRALEVFRLTGKPVSSYLGKADKERPFRILKTVIKTNREELYQRINLRVDEMMKCGFLDEARTLIGFRNLNAMNTVGYKELFSFLDGRYSLDEAVEKIKVNTRRYAKRQMTWFSKDQEIQWFHREEMVLLLQWINDHR